MRDHGWTAMTWYSIGRLSRSLISWAAVRSARRRPARAPERALDQLLQRVREQLPLGNRREIGDGGGDRLRRLAADDPLRGLAGREPPQAAPGATELRDHRFLRKRREVPNRAEPEQPQPAVRVRIERQHGQRLRREELPLLPGANDDRATWLGAGRGHPRDELAHAPPHPECGMRSVECG